MQIISATSPSATDSTLTHSALTLNFYSELLLRVRASFTPSPLKRREVLHKTLSTELKRFCSNFFILFLFQTILCRLIFLCYSFMFALWYDKVDLSIKCLTTAQSVEGSGRVFSSHQRLVHRRQGRTVIT